MRSETTLQRLLIVLCLAVWATLSTAGIRCFAQEATWTRQSPLPTSYNVEGVAVLSPDEIWIASAPLLGDVGRLAHTTDGGESWRTVDMPRQVNAVFFIDSQYGWAAGNSFFHTTDGGETWIQDNDWGSIYDLFFIDRLHGWAGGNGSVTYYTTDGGLTWNAVSAPGGWTIGSIWFIDQLNGWCANIAGGVCRTTDGGRSWFEIADLDSNNLQMVQFFDSMEGWAIGGNSFFHTVDGGNNWTRKDVPFNTWAYSARFANRMIGVAVGEYGNIVRTEDGGETWLLVAEQGSGQRLWDVEFGDLNTAVLTGDFGVVSRSEDRGASWQTIQSGGAGITRGMNSLDSQFAWAAQEAGEIAYTTNGGRKWIRSKIAGLNEYGRIHDVDFADPSAGWAGGWNDTFAFGKLGVLAHSIDGGRTWSLQMLIEDFIFEGVEALTDQRAYAVGNYEFGGGALILRTADGGRNWIDVTPGPGGFRDVFFLDESTGWAVGTYIYKTTNGGDNWSRQYSGNQLSAIEFVDANNGWAVGFTNTVLHTTDGGRTWTEQTIDAPPSTAVTGISAIDADTAWIAGWNGFVARTTDSGANWVNEVIRGAEDIDFEDLQFTSADQGWVGGNIGIWHRTLDGWLDIGSGLAGSDGIPGLRGEGELTGGSTNVLYLSNARPNATAHLVIGRSRIDRPFKGGTLVPSPDQVVRNLRVRADGTLRIQGQLPGNLPPGSELYFQFWIQDDAGPEGYAASNGLQAITR